VYRIYPPGSPNTWRLSYELNIPYRPNVVPNDDMWLQSFLSLPWSTVGTEVDTLKDPAGADLAVRRPGVPDPGLGTGSSTLPASGHWASYDCRSSGMQPPLFRAIPLIIISRNTESNSRIKSLFDKIWGSPAKGPSDAFYPLMSVAGGLSAILNDCDVHQSLPYHTTHDAYGCPSNPWHVAKR
jgi:hypothetical protein